jgi:rfaE bifunctional protein kinase chain/domain
MPSQNHAAIFDSFKNLHVAIIGDLIMDNYYWGNVERLSPEAPVPVVDIYKKENRLGGAANVARNCIALGAKASLMSVIGDDNDGKLLLSLMNESGINTDLVFRSSKRITTAKTRIMSRSRQMMRLDTETTAALETEDEHKLIDAVLRFLQIQKPDVLIFQDYNKGVLKENVIEKVIEHCKHLKIITTVDPKKQHFFTYRNVDIFKPNLKETCEGLGLDIENGNQASLDGADKMLRQQLQHHLSFITLSEKGVYYSDGARSSIIPSHIRNIADVSGAGDTVIAVASMVYAITKDAELMASYSNIAGGLVCEEIGVVPVNKEKLASEVIRLIPQKTLI